MRDPTFDTSTLMRTGATADLVGDLGDADQPGAEDDFTKMGV